MMRRKSWIRWFPILSMLLLATGCDYERNKLERRTETVTAAQRFSWIRTNILQPKCASCHNGTLPGVDVSSYATIIRQGLVVPGQPEASRLYRSIGPNGTMPKGGARLGNAELKIVFDWIRDGALENGTSVPPPPPPPPPKPAPTYAYMRYFFEQSCISCHQSPKPGGYLDLTTYRKLMDAPDVVTPGSPEESSLYNKLVTDNPSKRMPPPPTPKVDDARLRAVYDWIQQGAPEK